MGKAIIIMLWISSWGILPLSALAQQVAMSTPEVQAFHQKLDRAMGNIQSLHADFTQTKHLSFMDNPIKSSGKFQFYAPSKIRWEYVEPDRQVLNFDQNKLVIASDSKTKEIDLTRNRMYQQMSELMTSSMQGSKLFDTQKSQIDYFKNGKNYLVIMKPKDKRASRYIQHVELMFDPDSLWVQQIKILETSADYTLLHFQNQVKK